MKLERARMRLRLVLPSKDARRVREKITGCLVAIEQEDWMPELEIVRMYRELRASVLLLFVHRCV